VSPAAAQGVRYDTGLSVASGAYGSTETSTSVVWAHGVSFEAGRATVHATFPLVAQRGSAVLTAGGSVPGRGTGRDSTMSGGPRRVFTTDTAAGEYRVRAGDPNVSVSARVFENSRTSASAGVAVKVPLAAAGDIGTGEWDAGVTLDLSRHLAGPWFLAAGGAWWKLGDPEGLDLRDPLPGTLMLSRIGAGHAAAVMLSGGTSAAAGLDPPFSAGGMVSRDMWGGTAAISATLGLTSSAPDFMVGVTWGFALGT
jgi:hypothetical protein